MLIVDSHCHAAQSWYEPIEVLLFEMDSNGVDKAVLIQHNGAFDNSYLFECSARYPGRLAIVAMVDVSRPDALERLCYWYEEGAVGVRLWPTWRSSGSDPLAIWKKASELGLVVSCLGEIDDFASDEFNSLVSELPGLTIVVEHLAGVGQACEEPSYINYKKVLELASYPNTYIKIPGLGEINARPPVLNRDFGFDRTPPVIEMALNAFGPERSMWGSDFPPSAGREGYRNALLGIVEHPALANVDDREWVMGRTAQKVFKFD